MPPSSPGPQQLLYWAASLSGATALSSEPFRSTMSPCVRTARQGARAAQLGSRGRRHGGVRERRSARHGGTAVICSKAAALWAMPVARVRARLRLLTSRTAVRSAPPAPGAIAIANFGAGTRARGPLS